MNKKRIAIVHDWLPLLGGAEKVLKELTEAFPDSDIFTLFDFLTPDQRSIFQAKNIYTSYLNKLPFVKKYYRHLLAFCPQAIESFDLSDYDIIISSSYAVAKGVITRPHQTHISYVHSPARYAWDLMHKYLKQNNLDRGIKGFVAQNMLSKFRIWDYRTANGVDYFLSNSDYIGKRIYKTYRRDSKTIYPPTDISYFEPRHDKEDFYLAASRLVPYKRIDLIAKSFANLPDKKLVIIGDGPEFNKIKDSISECSNITMLGYQENNVLKDYMQRAKAFIFAAEEDFGIIPVEAQSCGTPVIAYGAGGSLETVLDIKANPKIGTGIFFDEQTEVSIIKAVQEFEAISYEGIAQNCRTQAEKFSVHSFKENMLSFVESVVPDFSRKQFIQ